MNRSEKRKQIAGFVLFAAAVFVFFAVFLVSNRIELRQTKQKYESQLEELRQLVNVTNLGESNEVEFDIYQTAADFLLFYYGVSEDVTAGYRQNKLMELMTENAYAEYDTETYDNFLGYTKALEDIRIYVDYKNSSAQGVYACIFFDENIDWPDINTITLKKYWTGIFVYDTDRQSWRIDEITDCQELLTREEFNALNVDTNGSVLDDTIGGAANDSTVWE